MYNERRRRLERVLVFSAIVYTLAATVSMAVVAASGLGWDEVAVDWLLHGLE